MNQYLWVIADVAAASSLHVFMLDVALKSCLLLLATLTATRLLHKRSAAMLHGLWTAGFAACLVVPVVALATPKWNLPILPKSWLNSSPLPSRSSDWPAYSVTAAQQRFGDSSKSAFQPTFPADLTMPLQDPKADFNGQLVSTRVDSRHSLPSTAAVFGGSPPARVIAAPRFSWMAACFAAWTAGAVICLCRSAWHEIALKRSLRRCRSLTDCDWQRAVTDVSRTIAFTRTVRLKEDNETQTPMVAGILQTIVVLPNDAEEWPPARRRLVLLHELAHAKRHDVLTQTLGAIACALYWFNPIGWWGLVQMRKLRELACDDMVIAGGQQPADYADMLLDIAKSYRHRRLATAVGMSRRTNIEYRISAILDKARSRMTMSSPAFKTLLLAATVVVVFIGSMRLQSQGNESAAPPLSSTVTPMKEAETPKGKSRNAAPIAKDQEGATEIAAEAAAIDPDVRCMEVRITDETGTPLAGANLYVAIWEFDGTRDYPNRDYTTNADGVTFVERPRRLQIIRMWPNKAGYVPEFVNFAEGTHEEGRLIPDRYEFQLARGTRLSGAVLDESGRPIEGVMVDVSVNVDEPAWGTHPKPMVSTWLTDEEYTEGSAITDKDGRWSINNAPGSAGGKDFTFRLKFTHKDCISDSKWGELQKEQNITTAALRDGSARIMLSRGVAVRGSVVDTSGKPVTKGLVVWSDDPYLAQGVNETQLDNAGHFQTLPLPPGERSLTVLAPGFRPERWTVDIRKGMDDLQFTLQPGHRLTLKVVDQDGKPIPKAYVGIGEWRGAKSIYNHKHPNVPESNVPRNADENGVYIWDWAPDDAVTYHVSAKGFSSTTATLIATPAAHIVELTRRLIAYGKVTDATTGQPVKSFSVTPVSVFRPKFLHSSFHATVLGVDGRYEVTLADNADDDYRYRIRIEADGYRSVLSEKSFGLEDGRVTQDFSLQPAATREGVVVDVGGNPVAAASVVEATPSILPAFDNTRFGWGDRHTETDDQGRFRLRATTEPFRIRIMHDAGFAEIARSPDEAIGTIGLRPWAKLSGQLLQDRKPVPDQRVSFLPVLAGELGEPRFQDSYSVQTDADGRFEFDRLPPIAGAVRASLGPWHDSPLTSSQSVPLDLKPGEHQRVTLGGEVTVTGQVVATGRDNATLNKNWSLNYLISRDRGIQLPSGFPSLSFDPRQPVEAPWFLDPNIHRWLNTREHHFIKLAPDGRFRICGVPPGTYDLVLRLYEQPAGCLVETVGEKVVTINVAQGDVASGSKDVGQIQVECRSGPRVGEFMGLYKFTDATGRMRSIQDMKGRHVLLHVWASWCEPCLESLPDIQATVARLEARPVTFVGLNVDKNASAAKELSRKRGWNWSQNYLGDSSDMARQLAISSVPTYFLVGPDSQLVASSVDWLEIKEKLEAAIDKASD